MAFSKRNILGVSIILAFAATGCGDDTGNAPGGSGGLGNPSTGGSGAVGSGGGGTIGSGGGTPGSGGGPGTGGKVASTVSTNGYVVSDPWKGYAYTVTDSIGSTVTPECDEAGTKPCFKDEGAFLCANGIIKGDPPVGTPPTGGYQGFAMIGWKLNQEEGTTENPNPTVGTWTMTGTGVKINVTNPLGTKMRIKVETADATEYCTDLTLTGGEQSVLWTAFKTECWTTTGVALPAGSALAAMAVQVPGETTDLDYDFCVVNVQPL